jgi:hypothetical protein
MLKFKFCGHAYEISIYSFNGLIMLGIDGCLLGSFRSKQQLISAVEEQGWWNGEAIRRKKLPGKILQKIEDFLRADESVWQGSFE